jgi:hypothetical protein
MNPILKSETKEQSKEGIHYYIEDRFRVFTELYHRERGFCCGNQCRHCCYNNTGSNYQYDKDSD